MKTKVAAIWCLVAYLSGCASPGRAPQAVSPSNVPAMRSETVAEQPADPQVRSGLTLAQRADHFAGRLREKAAQVPTRAQSILDTVGDSQLFLCVLPVLMVGGIVAGVLAGGTIGPLNFSPPAAPPS